MDDSHGKAEEIIFRWDEKWGIFFKFNFYLIFTDFLIFFIIIFLPKLDCLESSKVIIKKHDINVTLKCLLDEKHEIYNQKSHVTWWFKNSCKFYPCLNQFDEKFEQITTSNRTSLILNNENAKNGIYMCKITPYRLDSQVFLKIQFEKSFQVKIYGELKIEKFNLLTIFT